MNTVILLWLVVVDVVGVLMIAGSSSSRLVVD